MNIAVLGASGIQGRAALLDLARTPDVAAVLAVDVQPPRLDDFHSVSGLDKIEYRRADASDRSALTGLMREADAVIDLLPLPLMPGAFEAAVAAGRPLVSTNYAHDLRHFHERAVEAGVSILPECGLDPGIDLVLIGHGVRQFDRVTRLISYCGGIPDAAAAADNPLGYKISWNWDMVLRSQMRDSVFIQSGRRVEIPGAAQHDNDMIHQIDFPGLGRLEAVPNGDAVAYTDMLGLTDGIFDTGRYSLRWPGWCDFWRPLKKLGFFDTRSVPGWEGVTPRRFLVRHLEPRLRYQPDDKDVAAMYNVFEGEAGGRKKRLVNHLLIERDMETGLMAMAQGVGYTASITAQMLAGGVIDRPGLLSPVVDVPYEPFVAALAERGIRADARETFV